MKRVLEHLKMFGTQTRAMDIKLSMTQEERRAAKEKGLDALSIDIFLKNLFECGLGCLSDTAS